MACVSNNAVAMEIEVLNVPAEQVMSPFECSTTMVDGATTMAVYFPGMGCDGPPAHDRLLWRLNGLASVVSSATLHADEHYAHVDETGATREALGLYRMMDGYSADENTFAEATERAIATANTLLAKQPSIRKVAIIGYSLGGPSTCTPCSSAAGGCPAALRGHVLRRHRRSQSPT